MQVFAFVNFRFANVNIMGLGGVIYSYYTNILGGILCGILRAIIYIKRKLLTINSLAILDVSQLVNKTFHKSLKLTSLKSLTKIGVFGCFFIKI